MLKKPYFFHDLWKNRWMTVAFMIMGIEINAYEIYNQLNICDFPICSK